MDDVSEILKNDPGNPVFVKEAERLIKLGRFQDAQDVCFAGISANPSAHRGRLLLSRIFYERGYLPFAVRELEELSSVVKDNRFLKRILEKLAPQLQAATAGNAGGGERVVAETDFDIGDIELLDEEEENKGK